MKSQASTPTYTNVNGVHVDTEVGHCVQERTHGLKGFDPQGFLGPVPHPDAVFHPRSAEFVELTLLGPMGNVGRFDWDVGDLSSPKCASRTPCEHNIRSPTFK